MSQDLNTSPAPTKDDVAAEAIAFVRDHMGVDFDLSAAAASPQNEIIELS